MSSIKLAFSMIWLMAKQKFSKKNSIRQSFKRKHLKFKSDPKYDGYQRGLASMVYKVFDKKSSGDDLINEANYPLADELHKPIIRKFEKKKYIHHSETIFGE